MSSFNEFINENLDNMKKFLMFLSVRRTIYCVFVICVVHVMFHLTNAVIRNLQDPITLQVQPFSIVCAAVCACVMYLKHVA